LTALFILSSFHHQRTRIKFSLNDFEILENDSAALSLYHVFIGVVFRTVRMAIAIAAADFPSMLRQCGEVSRLNVAAICLV
jgi:hypothetical protein